LARGGANDPKNLQLAHPRCNIRKKAKDPLVFARELGRLL
jgi:5-methylcytosine-specific restriction endonuclease McrA